MTAAKLRLAQAAMGKPETSIAELCAELEVTRQTLYRHTSGRQTSSGRKGARGRTQVWARTFTGPHARGKPDRIGERGHNAYDQTTATRKAWPITCQG